MKLNWHVIFEYIGIISSLIDVLVVICGITRSLLLFLLHRHSNKLQPSIGWYQNNTLQQVSNSRYGFSLNRPLSWVMLNDPPTNNDGVEYVDPHNKGIGLVAYGSHTVVIPGITEIESRRKFIIKLLLMLQKVDK